MFENIYLLDWMLPETKALLDKQEKRESKIIQKGELFFLTKNPKI
jgi:hypothetical protein